MPSCSRPLPLPVLDGAETSRARFERVGVRGQAFLRMLRSYRILCLAPHPKFAFGEFRPLPASAFARRRASADKKRWAKFEKRASRTRIDGADRGRVGVLLVRQIQKMRAFDELVGDRRDQADIEEKLVSKARFEFERPPDDLAGFFEASGQRQRDGLEEIKRAEARIGL